MDAPKFTRAVRTSKCRRLFGEPEKTMCPTSNFNDVCYAGGVLYTRVHTFSMREYSGCRVYFPYSV